MTNPHDTISAALERARILEHHTDDEIEPWLTEQCNRWANGHCETRRCMKRGGYSGIGPVENMDCATCEPWELLNDVKATVADIPELARIAEEALDEVDKANRINAAAFQEEHSFAKRMHIAEARAERLAAALRNIGDNTEKIDVLSGEQAKFKLQVIAALVAGCGGDI